MGIRDIVFNLTVMLAVASLLVSLALLWAYRRAVKRSMLRSVAPAKGVGAEAARAPGVATVPLKIGQTEAPSKDAVRSVWRGPRRIAAIHVIAGLIYAMGVTLAWDLAGRRAIGWPGFDWQLFAMFTLFFAWPLVVVISLVATVSWRDIALVVFAYAALLAAAALYLIQGTGVTPTFFAARWWHINGPATLFVLAILARPIRAMGPIVAALVVATWAGVYGMANFLDKAKIEMVASVAGDLGFSGNIGGLALGLVIFASAAIAAALAGYFFLLRGLGRLYRAQWVSDQSIQIDAVWLTFAVLQAPAQLGYEGGLATFFLYKLVASIGQRLVGYGDARDSHVPRLLLLRVFSLGSRSERLFNAFSRLWRHTGPLRMIAGPDLGNSTVEPHEFLDFLAGRLNRFFITGPSVLEQRLAETKHRRDPDGRFRVSDYFCHADTWQMVLRRLVRDSDAVLVDLRGFTKASQGCVYELRELPDAVRLENFVLVVDGTTDEGFLTEVLSQGWTDMGDNSPNRTDPNPSVRLYRLETVGAQGIGRLVATMTAIHGRDPAPVAAL